MGKMGILAFAFGTPATIKSNQLITEITLGRAREDRAPIFTQADIQFPREFGLDVTYVKEEPGKPPPTLRIARAGVQWALLKHLNELVVVAAGPHMWRCWRDTKEAVREIGAEGWLKVHPQSGISMYAKENWFCPDSTQRRTTSEKEWYRREWLLEFMPMRLYKKMES